MDEKLSSVAKYNFWGKEDFNVGFPRTGYTEKIRDFTGNRLIKVLVGQRRTGKSYILRQVAKNLINSGVKPENILFINKEFIEYDFLSDYNTLHDFIKSYLAEFKPKGRVCFFIDEIQNINGWERLVNSYSQDYTAEYEFFISGSNSKMISAELATLLTGRYITFPIFPFSFNEYCGITGSEISKTAYTEYMQSGGLPELFVLPGAETKRNYVSAIKDTVLLRDIIQRQNIREPGLLEDIFVYLVNNASNLISVSNIFNYFKGLGRKTSYDIVANYTAYLQDAFLVHRCERYDIRGKQTIAGNVKFYTNDLAYKNYLYPGFGYGFGYMLENLVYLELRRAGYEVYTGSIRNREVDFIARKADRLLYLQSAYLLAEPETIAREFGALEEIDDNFEKIVVTLDDLVMPSYKGIKHVQAWKLGELL